MIYLKMPDGKEYDCCKGACGCKFRRVKGDKKWINISGWR